MAQRTSGVGIPGVTGIPYVGQKLANAENAFQRRGADLLRARYEGSHELTTGSGRTYRVDIHVEGPRPIDWINGVGNRL